MIDSLFFILQVVGIVVILGWVVVQDRLEEGAQSSGPLAFKQKDAAEPSQRRARASGLTRRQRRVTLEN